MKINIKSEKLILTKAIKDYTKKKINALEKFINTNSGNLIAHAIVGKTTAHHQKGKYFKAEIKLDIPQKSFLASSQKDDLYAAIDRAQDKIKMEIVKYKERLLDRQQRG
jgi:putative sigma-54 modulation protein